MRFKLSNLISCLAISSFLCGPARACWGKTAPDYGEMTRDYDLLEGSELILNCTLKAKLFPEIPRLISSADLIFEKGDIDFSNLTRRIDDLTIQLKIPSAKLSDSGFYYCKILTSNETKPVVCGSKVSVGYPPKHVSNFTCLSKNYDNLTCSWDIENSGILTKYTVVKYYLNVPGFEQKCPDTTEKPNSCEWTMDTEPKYQPFPGNVSFSVKGNNSLGISIDNFTIDGYAIVIPNSPEKLKLLDLGNQSVKVGWFPPQARNFGYKLPMQFEIWIGKIDYDPSNIQVFDAGNNTSEFIIQDLIPNVLYNISIRCRSSFAKGERMWSSLVSILVKTLPDVPYEVPEVIPEAFEYHLYEDSRSVTLYWKAVPSLFHNGENFHYRIKYLKGTLGEHSNISFVDSPVPSIEIKRLSKDESYYFYIYSANQEGISKKFDTIFVDKQNKIPPGPKYIRAISQDLGHYNLSWKAPNIYEDLQYIVFWCSSLKPWRLRCDSPIEWFNNNLTENSMILNLTDVKTNFQFAVVSKSGNMSSGMQWASCIVPHKAALGKIRYVVVEPKASSTLKVIWNLDCPAQKAVVERYEIIYCRINKNEECKVATVEPNAESYILQYLHPYSNYSIKIRAFNKDNLPSEDSDAILQMTLPGAPSGPPQNVKTYPKSNSSFYVSWTSPLEPNGIITKYIISYNESSMYLNVLSSKSQYDMEVNGLDPFSTFAVQVQACVNDSCSVKSEVEYIQTEVGEPGPMEPPRIDQLNSTHLKVSWSAPLHPNGPIDFYNVVWHEKVQNETSSIQKMVQVSSGMSVFIDLECSRLGDLGIKYLFYVRAVNMKNGTSLYGPYSEPTLTTACMMSQGLAMIIGIAIGGTLALAVLVLVIYKLVKWMKEKIHQVKSITIRLPKGLEGPETNPLNNYEYFKNGLGPNTQENSTERLSYIIDENDKNRHGSGSSQFSNSSTDELVFKTGKCTKFGRKPSGDSSGCSSMSSNMTPRTHLSSDSGTESDFCVPPSPDSAITEQSLHSCHKPPLPILMEVHDQTTPEQSCQRSITDNQFRRQSAVDDMVLKVDQPYSKFGVAGSDASCAPWRINSLAFYSCNLANSEPSVFDIEKTERQNAPVAPYSKVGLAKSSSDIMGISPMKEIGYSKFGMSGTQKRFSIPPVNLNPIAMVMLESSDQKQWPSIQKLVKNKTDAKNSTEQQPLTVPPRNIVGDCGYIKVGMRNLSKKPSPGYVPFNDLKSQQDHKPLPMSNHSHPSQNSFFTPPAEKDHIEVSDGTECPHDPFAGESVNYISESNSTILFDSLFSENNNSSPKLPETYNPVNLQYSLPSKLPFEPDIKCSYDFPPLSQNSVHQNQLNDFPITGVYFPQEYPSSNQCKSENSSAKEVVITPSTLRNGYVPFSTLSDSVCDRTLTHIPNASHMNSPLFRVPNGVCTEADNYVTPSNKGDLRLLRDDSLSRHSSVLPTKDSFKDTKLPIHNGFGNGSLTYILKPLPKMESEICEV